MIHSLEKQSSIIFISETRVKDKTQKSQVDQIQITGYKLIAIDNSPTNAGGTAIYASDDLKCSPRSDIKFNYPNCEACFVQVECDAPGPSPIFGALYRHPGHEAHSFCTTWENF